MKAAIQRVSRAKVTVGGKKINEIGNGLLIFLGIFCEDAVKDMEYLIQKTAGLRIFNDKNDNMNLSLNDVSGSVLVVSQFTLCANTQKGRRPSFFNAAEPKKAKDMYNNFCAGLQKKNIPVYKGIFGETMRIELINEGPVTIILDSKLSNQ